MPLSRLTADDVYLFNEGTHSQLYDRLGAHPSVEDGVEGTVFAVWAPDASEVSVLADLNGWKAGRSPLQPVAESGIWQGFVAGIGHGAAYKYAIQPRAGGELLEKADPVAAYAECPPASASRIWRHDYRWGDETWMTGRVGRQSPEAPIVIYELHAGSWKRVPDEGNRPMTYRELAETLPDHVAACGFDFVEFLPLMEHPYGPSWGYQVTGYFAPTARYGTPEDLKYLIDMLHQRGIGVILDWVPSHFPTDAHGLARFDGAHLYEHEDPRQGFHPDWSSAIFNYGRNEVRSFLLSSAAAWLDLYHIDGIRVDAVASMLYLDYSRKEGEWIPNEYGGNENLAAIGFLRQFTSMVHDRFPGAATYAEESTAWPGVTAPVSEGGLGFDFKWDMGWMHDTLGYFSRDPVHRMHHHDELTFRSVYGLSERFALSLSHDEVVHGKGSLLSKMPGDDWQQFANLRMLYTYMYTLSGKKLLFMGGEFGQRTEWAHDGSLEWHVLEHPLHHGVLSLVGDLGRLYRRYPALHTGDHDPDGFAWVVGDDRANSVFAYFRHAPGTDQWALVVLNATPVPRHGYRIGVPWGGRWQEVLNSNAEHYGGSGLGNGGGVDAEPVAHHGQDHSLNLTLPPLAAVVLLNEPGAA